MRNGPGLDAVVWQTAVAPLRVVENGHLTRHRRRQGPRTRTRPGGRVPVVASEIERSLIGHVSNPGGSVRTAVRSARAETPVASGRECRTELRRAGQMLTTRQHYPASGSATSHQGSVRAVRTDCASVATRRVPLDSAVAQLSPVLGSRCQARGRATWWRSTRVVARPNPVGRAKTHVRSSRSGRSAWPCPSLLPGWSRCREIAPRGRAGSRRMCTVKSTYGCQGRGRYPCSIGLHRAPCKRISRPTRSQTRGRRPSCEARLRAHRRR